MNLVPVGRLRLPAIPRRARIDVFRADRHSYRERQARRARAVFSRDRLWWDQAGPMDRLGRILGWTVIAAVGLFTGAFATVVVWSLLP